MCWRPAIPKRHQTKATFNDDQIRYFVFEIIQKFIKIFKGSKWPHTRNIHYAISLLAIQLILLTRSDLDNDRMNHGKRE